MTTSAAARTPMRAADPRRAALVRGLRKYGYPEKSIYRWLASDGPRDSLAKTRWKAHVAKVEASLSAGAA